MKHLATTHEVIAELGGQTKAAQKLGHNASTVQWWVVKGCFPARSYLALSTKLRSLGIEVPIELFNFERPDEHEDSDLAPASEAAE